MTLINCTGVSLAYDGNVALSDVSFTVEAGDYLCVLGENGSGKSTLIKGLLKLKTPVSGKIAFSGGLEPSMIGYLPQQTAAQKDFPATVLEVVLSGRLNSCKGKPFYSKEDKKTALEKIALMGMEPYARRSYQELSGGQQQRVLLARALCATKKLILLDEPVAGLDPVVTAGLYALVKELNEQEKITVVMVSHDLLAVRYATHILHLGKRQLFFGRTADYLQTPLGKRFMGGDEVD